MTYKQCLSKIGLELDVLFHRTYRGLKLNGFYILPADGNSQTFFNNAIAGDFKLKPYVELNAPLEVFVSFKTETGQVKCQKLDDILTDLDDNSW